MLESLHPLFLTVHVTTVSILVILVIVADVIGMRWVRGAAPVLSAVLVRRLHLAVWCGIGIMAFSGISMFWPYREYLLFETAFRIKMLFVGALIINAFFIGKLNRLATTTSFENLPPGSRLRMFASGGVSLVSWVGAITCGLLLDI